MAPNGPNSSSCSAALEQGLELFSFPRLPTPAGVMEEETLLFFSRKNEYFIKDGTLVVKLVVMADGSKRPVVPTAAHLDPRGAFLLHSPKDRTMYLWVGPDVGVAAVTEAAARAAARAAALSRRGSSTRVRESYEEAGRFDYFVLTR